MASEEMKLKEVKNGRLAMLAFLGFASTAAVNGMGPIASLNYHIADPGHHNSEWLAQAVMRDRGCAQAQLARALLCGAGAGPGSCCLLPAAKQLRLLCTLLPPCTL